MVPRKGLRFKPWIPLIKEIWGRDGGTKDNLVREVNGKGVSEKNSGLSEGARVSTEPGQHMRPTMRRRYEYLGAKASQGGWQGRAGGVNKKTVWRDVRTQVAQNLLELTKEAGLCFKRIVQTLSHWCSLHLI